MRDVPTTQPSSPAPPQGLSIRAHLRLLVLVVLLPAALLAYWLILDEYHRDIERSRQDIVARVRALSTALDAELLRIQSGLQALAVTAPAILADRETLYRTATAFQREARLENVVLLDDQGRQVLNTKRALGDVLPALGEQAPALPVIRTGQPLSMLTAGALDGKPLVIVSVPVSVDGAPRYALSSGVPFARLDGLLAQQEWAPGWIAVILDPSGLVVSRTTLIERFLGQPAAPGLRHALEAAPEGIVEFPTLEGIDVMTAYRRAPRTGWAVAIGIPKETLVAPLRHWLLLLGLAIAALLAVSLALATLLQKRIVRSMTLLVDTSGRIGGDGEIRVPALGFREAQQVADAMGEASRKLAEARRNVLSGNLQWQSLMDAAMDGVVVADAQQRIVNCNKAAGRMFGYRGDEMIGLPLAALVPPGVRESHAGFVAAMAADSARAMGFAGRVVEACHARGHLFPIEASIAAVQDPAGRLYMAIVRDVTDRQRAQDAIVRSNIELGRFAHAAAHDMRSPLRSIAGFMAVLEEQYAGALPVRGRELVARSRRAAERLDALTRDLLAYARLQSGEVVLETVDAQAVLEDCMSMLSGEIEAAGATVRSAGLPRVRANAAFLTQVLQNLVVNAIRYRSDAAPVIDVSVAESPDGWTFTVRDNGTGIEPAYHEKIFEMFQRANQKSVPGSGIGLAVCRRIIELHGGRMWVESAPGEGSSFRFTLPRERAAP